MAGRVLVVDDEKMIVKGLKFSLMQDYSVVDCAYDGEEALEYAKNNEYDIILLDIMLPIISMPADKRVFRCAYNYADS